MNKIFIGRSLKLVRKELLESVAGCLDDDWDVCPMYHVDDEPVTLPMAIDAVIVAAQREVLEKMARMMERSGHRYALRPRALVEGDIRMIRAYAKKLDLEFAATLEVVP